MRELWAHQKEAIERARGKGSFALFMEPGTGKTCTAIHILRNQMNDQKKFLRTLIFCPPIICQQWRGEVLENSKVEPDRVIVLNGPGSKRLKTFLDNPGPRIFITNYESLLMKPLYQAFTQWEPQALIFDECFVGDTLVDTSKGPVKISEIKPGDMVYNCLGLSEVKNVFVKRNVSDLVTLYFGEWDFKITCSSSHLFLTGEGWVQAKDLIGHVVITTREALQAMQCRVHSSKTESPVLRETLLSELDARKHRCWEEDWGCIAREATALEQEENARTQPYEIRNYTREGESNPSYYGPQAFGEEGEWARAYCPGTAFVEDSSIEGVGLESCSGDKRLGKRVPPELQDRLGQPENKSGSGGRWGFPWSADSTETGSKKGEKVNFFRVDHLEIHESRSADQARENPLYDLEIEGHPSFSVHGLVVHNCHKIKSYNAKRSVLAERLANPLGTKPHKQILTGTPVLNDALDLFQQFLALDGGETLGHNFFVYRAQFFRDKNAGMDKQKYFPDWRPLPGAVDEINRLISPKSICVKKQDCLDLPDLVKTTVKVPMVPSQRKMYEEMKKDFVTFVEDQACTATLAVTKGLRLMQLASGFAKVEGGEEIALEDNPKQEALRELLDTITPAHKVLVWCVFKQNYAQVREVCEKLGIGLVEITGEQSEKQKQTAVARFKEDNSVRVLCGHPQSGGVGLNLIEASYMIFYSRNFSLENDIQAEARCYRGGSEIHPKITRIDLVTENSIEEMVAEKLALKMEISFELLKQVR